MELIYQDKDIVICLKPPGVVSTDEPGGVPELVRAALGEPEANVRTVHRLDAAVSGLMVLARRAKAAGDLSRQIREGTFRKEYLAVIQGHPEAPVGELRDLLLRDRRERRTYIVTEPGKDAREAVLRYEVVGENRDMSRVRIQLLTGRTHQIRAQFSGRGMPLVGDRKYGTGQGDFPIALWSCRLGFCHPYSGEPMEFFAEPPDRYPWTEV